MGRFSSILFLLVVGCGDNLVVDEGGPSDRPDEVATTGNKTVFPRYVPAVCSVQRWTNTVATDPMNVSVVARPEGATMLATARDGGRVTGINLDARMSLLSSGQLAIDGTFTQAVASLVGDRLTSAAVQDNMVVVHLLDNDLASAQYQAKFEGRYVAEPAFFNVQGTSQADLVMPIAGDDGLWLHRFDDSFQPLDSMHIAATDPARSLAAVQFGVGILAAWSTDTSCHMMMAPAITGGIERSVDSPCTSPRIAANGKAGEAIMVFDSAAGVRMMYMRGQQFGGDAPLIRAEATAPRAVFDGTNFWLSYLDRRGDLVVGFLDATHHPVTTVVDLRPDAGAYDLVLINGSPWVLSFGADGYSAHRMCVTTEQQ